VLAASLETADPAFGVPRAACTYRKRRADQRLHTGSSRRSRRTASGPCFYLFDGIDHPLRIKITTPTTVTAYYELDLAGNVRGLRASGGASLGGYRYSAFGKTLEDTTTIAQPLRWKARWFSPVAGGTYDVRARQWSPELGVFLSVDEFEYHDRHGTLWSWPGQSPVLFSDPTGHLPWGPPNPPPVPPTPPGPRSCEPDDDRTPCQKDCDAAHDRDHARCKDFKTPKERERCHSDANEDYAACLKRCGD